MGKVVAEALKFVAVFSIIVALASSVWAQAQPEESLEGPAFSDPSKVYEMPKKWLEDPIEYEPEAAGSDLAVTLDQHLFPAILPLINKFARERNVKISVSEGTCGTSAGRLLRKAVDIAGFCCPPGELDRLPGVEFHTLGVEPIALIVHPNNPVDDIKLEDARRVFRGLVFSWAELGGDDVSIQPVGRLHCKLRPGHWRLLLGNEDLFSPRLEEVGTIPDMITLVANNPRAIGYEAIQMIRKYGAISVKMLKVDGVDPAHPSSVQYGRYPFYRTLVLTTWKGKNENRLAGELVDYLLENSGLLEKRFGIVPASSLRKTGWKFEGDELVGEPE
ncbi:MAG: hypothetical protein P8Y85_05520 [Nitrospirota bacterium]|jgi:phosphate transport system substrate-binding protein